MILSAASISLIANSGIQFHEIPLSLGDNSAVAKFRFDDAETYDPDVEKVYLDYPYELESGEIISRLAINLDAVREDGTIDERKIRPECKQRIREDQIINLNGRDALNLLEGQWLPLPYFRAEHYNTAAVKPGPYSWARLYLGRVGTQQQQAGSAYTHKLVLAFDTYCDEEDAPTVNTEYYLVPNSRDPEGGKTQFRCATADESNGQWLSQQWVSGWLERALLKRKAALPRQLTDPDRDPYELLYLGFYIALLKLLDRAGGFPAVTLQDGGLTSPIDVNLVLDVGNSRTCGLVLESGTRERDNELALTDAKRLRIRELWNPTRSSDQPFDMKLAFMEARFGSDGGQHDNRLFRWPSLVRVGPEATRYGIIYGEGQPLNGQYEMTFSSPKRYLWDDKRREKPWGYFSEAAEVTQCPATFLPLADKFTIEGLLVSKANKQAVKLGESPYSFANTPQFPRRSLMTFALAEIILQTISYINSYEYRLMLGEVGRPRRLRRIVLTCPTAMPKFERVHLRECAADALGALRDFYGHGFPLLPADLEILPAYENVKENDPEYRVPKDLRDLKENGTGQHKTAWGYDEATCSQLVFFYNEIVHRFKPANASLFFETMGRYRQGNYQPDQKSLMVASVDIGGGTTDLMIAHYEYEKGPVSCLHPSPVFWEGFNVAGDQLLKRLIEAMVLPPIAAEAKRLGCTNAGNVLYRLFGPYQSTDTDAQRTRKKLFANQVSMVIAQGMLEQITRQPGEARQMAYDEFFLNHEMPIPGVISYVNEAFRREGAPEFDLRLMHWAVQPDSINEQVIRNVMGKVLLDLCQIISQYDCDYVLLSGRPSTLPAVFDLFLQYLPTAPDRIIPMNRLRVATSEKSWYPFGDQQEYVIRDPKTCVSVGASIALLAELGLLGGMRLDTHLLASRMTSTADYIGLITTSPVPSIRTEHVLVSPDDPGPTIMKFEGGQDTVLGMRQMSAENWLATPMYRIDYVSETARQQLQSKLPIELSVKRSSRNDKEKLSLAKGANLPGTDEPALTLTPCTLPDPYGYWLDTGNFQLDL